MTILSYKSNYTASLLSAQLLRIISCFISVQILLFIIITSAYSAQVTLAWDANTESDLAGYKIYYGNASKNYTHSLDVRDRTAITCTISNLIEGQTYYFAATAYNTSFLESAYSAEVFCTINAPITTIPQVTTTIALHSTTTIQLITSSSTSSLIPTTSMPTTSTTALISTSTIPTSSVPITTTSLQPTTTTTADPITSSSTTLIISTTSMSTTTITGELTTSTTTAKSSKTSPQAKAGGNRKIKLGTTVTLDGTQSYDPDGDRLQYFWQVINGPSNYKLKKETTAKPIFKPTEVGTYEIGLKVFDGTYYSEEDSVAITVEDNSSGDGSTDNGVNVWCPFFFLTDNNTEKMTRLRDFRNNVLLKTPIGRKYVWFFYKNSTELITILINNEGIAHQSKLVLEELLPKIELAVEGHRINITPIKLLEIEGILNQISMEASAELKQAIEKLEIDLRDEKTLHELGIESELKIN